MIRYIPCPATTTGRECGADLLHAVWTASKTQTGTEQVRVQCPICAQWILVEAHWQSQPVITRATAMAEESET